MRFVGRIGAALAGALVLTACSFGGQPTGSTQPTAASRPTAVVTQPTAVAAQPTALATQPAATAVPTTVVAQPTTAPQPTAIVQPTAAPQPTTPAQPTPVDAADAVRLFLASVQADRSGKTALPYIGGELRHFIEQGATVDMGGVLIEQNPFTGFTIGNILGTDGGYALVQATLSYGQPPQPSGKRLFTVGQEGGSWRVFAVALDEASQEPAGSMDQQAREVLATFLDLLHRGAYTEAAAYTNADFAELQQLNPDITDDPTNNLEVQGRLLERACTANGYACFQQRHIVGVTVASRDEALVAVELNNPDGSLFQLPASGTSTFEFRVQRFGPQVLVTSLPPYVS